MDLPLVHVLLATYNGAEHLAEQLDSLAQQTGVRVQLHVSDDGSTDGSLELLSKFKAWPLTLLAPQPRVGPTANFFRLMNAVLPQMKADEWVALCDQDDIWHADKLARAVQALSQLPTDQPIAYGARTLVVDAHNQPIGLSRLHKRPTVFRNALVQCIVGSNTQMVNRKALELMLHVKPHAVPSHDWWCYQVVTGCGGTFVYDPVPCLRYRQHHKNAVGFNRGLKASVQRAFVLLAGDYGQWNGTNVQALQRMQALLTPEASAVCADFQTARLGAGIWQRLGALKRSKVYRQSPFQSLGLWVACVLKRL